MALDVHTEFSNSKPEISNTYFLVLTPFGQVDGGGIPLTESDTENIKVFKQNWGYFTSMLKPSGSTKPI